MELINSIKLITLLILLFMEFIVRQKIDLIAECIFEKIQRRDETASISYGLYSGEFGVLLFLFYYSRYLASSRYRLLAENYAERLFNEFLSKVNLHTFCNGFSGILYLFQFLRENDYIDMDVSDSQSLLDNFLIKQMRNDIQQRDYDFMHGALGVGLYILKQRTNTECIQELINFLYQTAEKDSEKQSFKWKSISHARNFFVYNLALSHGISSIIIFLSRVINNGMIQTKVVEMLSGAVNYVLSLQRDSSKFGSHFPSYLTTDFQQPPSKSRLAWCYGDLGIALALWQAGKAIDNKEWKDKGLEIFLQSTKRRIACDTFVADAGICHGSAGIALIFYRMYSETLLREFKEAADFWICETLSFSKFENGLAGFRAYSKGDWVCDYSLLTGISGIGLALMSYIRDDIQSWDEVFLLS